ncbi:MAG: hypothetical protein JW809_12625 [Pirellulales bacterium]|nr:hypothetical protein [Pirellulales bacterium]
MAVFPKKLDLERLFRQPSARAAASASKRPASGKPGSWRVVTADGCTTVSSLARRAGTKPDELLHNEHAEVVLRHDRGGRPTTIKLVSPAGRQVSLAELDLVDTDVPAEDAKPSPPAPRPADNRPTASKTNVNLAMPRASAVLADALRDDAVLRVGKPDQSRGRWFTRLTSRKKKAELFDIRPAARPLAAPPDVDLNGIDLDLVRVIELWPTLAPRIRDAILALVDAAK